MTKKQSDIVASCDAYIESKPKTIHEVLNDIQVHLKAPKSQYNSFGKYSYRKCEDILEGLKPMLKEHGATLVITDDVVAVLDRVYVKATAVFALSRDDNCITSTAFAREPLSRKGMDDSQLTGATSSYARKYALNGLFCIDDTADADTKDNTEETAHRFKKGEADEILRQCLDCIDRDDAMELNKILHESCLDDKGVVDENVRNKVWDLFTAQQRATIKVRLGDIQPPLNGE